MRQTTIVTHLIELGAHIGTDMSYKYNTLYNMHLIGIYKTLEATEMFTLPMYNNIRQLWKRIRKLPIIDLGHSIYFLRAAVLYIRVLGEQQGRLLIQHTTICEATVYQYKETNSTLWYLNAYISIFKKYQHAFAYLPWRAGMLSNYYGCCFTILMEFLPIRVGEQHDSPLSFIGLFLRLLVTECFIIPPHKSAHEHHIWLGKAWRLLAFFRYFMEYYFIPDTVVCVNPTGRIGIVHESKRLGIPAIMPTDTDQIFECTYPLLSNDDSMPLSLFYFQLIINAYELGRIARYRGVRSFGKQANMLTQHKQRLHMWYVPTVNSRSWVNLNNVKRVPRNVVRFKHSKGTGNQRRIRLLRQYILWHTLDVTHTFGLAHAAFGNASVRRMFTPAHKSSLAKHSNKTIRSIRGMRRMPRWYLQQSTVSTVFDQFRVWEYRPWRRGLQLPTLLHKYLHLDEYCVRYRTTMTQRECYLAERAALHFAKGTTRELLRIRRIQLHQKRCTRAFDLTRTQIRELRQHSMHPIRTQLRDKLPKVLKHLMRMACSLDLNIPKYAKQMNDDDSLLEQLRTITGSVFAFRVRQVPETYVPKLRWLAAVQRRQRTPFRVLKRTMRTVIKRIGAFYVNWTLLPPTHVQSSVYAQFCAVKQISDRHKRKKLMQQIFDVYEREKLRILRIFKV